MKEQFMMVALRIGIAVPFLYFGIQIIAAPFYPNYSFLARDASTLGSDGSNFPAIFNVGSIIIGIIFLLVAWGFLVALQRLNVSSILAWITSLALVGCALASINAGIFPLPDPRHTDGFLALFGVGTLLLPFLLPASLWRLRDAQPVKLYFIVNVIAILALIPFMTGLIQRISIMAGVDLPGFQNFLNNYQGLLQRIAALLVFPPIGISAYFLAKRVAGKGI